MLAEPASRSFLFTPDSSHTEKFVSRVPVYLRASLMQRLSFIRDLTSSHFD